VKGLALQEQGKGPEAKPLFDKAMGLAPAQYKDQIGRLASGSAPGSAPGAAPGVTKPDGAKPETKQSDVPAAKSDVKPTTDATQPETKQPETKPVDVPNAAEDKKPDEVKKE
jgi:hypothetical protein